MEHISAERRFFSTDTHGVISVKCRYSQVERLSCILDSADAPAHTNILAEKNEVGIVYEPSLSQHKHPSRQHPESPDRIVYIMRELESQGLIEKFKFIPAKAIDEQALLYVHSENYIRRLKRMYSSTRSNFEAEAEQYDSLYLNRHSLECARKAVGGLISICKAVLDGQVKRGIALIRPPGHHAESHGPKGFCLFNNIAVAAQWIRKHGASRVLIVDWDVHHGNGTQKAFYSDSSVLYCSIHRYDRGSFFPHGSDGSYKSIGQEEGRGYNVNIAWEGQGAGDCEYVSAFRRVILPLAQNFDADIILVSAGFDASSGDYSMGGCKVSPQCYAYLTKELMAVANGRVVLALEGGYSKKSLGQCVSACCKVLLEEPLLEKKFIFEDLEEHLVLPRAKQSIDLTISVLRPYWPGVFENI